MGQLTEDQKTINFSNEANLNDIIEDTEFLNPNYNLSNIGFEIGIKYNINL